MKRVYVYINGIFTYPGSADGWTDRAVTWTHINTEHRAEKYEYMTGVLTRRIFQNRRAEKLAKMIGFYGRADYEIVLIGHSNGCDIILRVLKMINKQHIKEIHLVAAACEADFRKNGLRERLISKQIDNIYIYIGGKDEAMRFAELSQKLLKRFGLGYGNLGGQDPSQIARIISEWGKVIFQPHYGHSTWWNRGPHEGYGTSFNNTMRTIMKP